MKKLILTFAIILTIVIANSQSKNVNNAFNYLKKNKIAEAKIAIDEASEHVDTKDQAKVWFYKGNIYLAIYSSKDPKIKSLDNDALEKAYEFYNKAITIDQEVFNGNLDIKTPFEGLQSCAIGFYNKGILEYNKDSLHLSYNYFIKSFSINKDYNALYFAGLTAYYSKPPRTEVAKGHFIELSKAKFQNENLYKLLTTIYILEKDTVKAFNTVENAEKLFADSMSTMLLKFSTLSWAGKPNEAYDIINKLKLKAPNDYKNHFNIGALLSDIGNFEESEKAYLKSLELNPKIDENFDAYFNIGVLYFNKFVEIKKESDKLDYSIKSNQDKMQKLETESKVFLDKALPYVEKCFEFNKNDYNTLVMLKQIYANKNMNAKAKEINEMMLKLKK